MNYRLIVRPEAEADLAEAAEWYEERRVGLGVEFISEIGAKLTAIQENPFMFPKVHKEARRALAKRFPYAIYFIPSGEMISVVGVFHCKRDPKRWQARIP
jgi:plasmid stabilization system protein ParE